MKFLKNFDDILAMRRNLRLTQLERSCATIAWTATALMGLLSGLVSGDFYSYLFIATPDSVSHITTVSIAIISVGLFGKLLVSIVARKRLALFLLLTSLSLLLVWVITNYVIGTPSEHKFPSASETIYMFSYLFMAAFVITDRPSRIDMSLNHWLDAAIACVCTVAVIGYLLDTPITEGYSKKGILLLFLLIPPVLDTGILSIIVGQIILGTRELSKHSIMLSLGFALLVYSEATFLNSDENYSTQGASQLAWITGILLIVTAATPAPPPRQRAFDDKISNTYVLVIAMFISILILLLTPSGHYIPTGLAGLCLLLTELRIILIVKQARSVVLEYKNSSRDELTGMPNRNGLIIKINDEFSAGNKVCLIVCKINDFKSINETLGYHAGDETIKIIASRIWETFENRYYSARLDGNVFAIVLPTVDTTDIGNLASKIRKEICAPFYVDNVKLPISVTLGATCSTESLNAQDFVRQASIALDQARKNGRDFEYFKQEFDNYSVSKLKFVDELRSAIVNREFVVWYQPQIDASTGALVSAEALVRWDHPQQGILPPGIFLDTAKTARMMGEITMQIIDQVCKDTLRLNEIGTPMRISLNISPNELTNPEILNYLIVSIESLNLQNQVVVEVTEDSFASARENVTNSILRLASQNIQVSIDDFGTGYSSLSYLKDLPVHELKIAQEFVMSVASDPRCKSIVTAATVMAHELKMRVVAEGVENVEIADELRDLDVDIFQGYYFSKPISYDHFKDYVCQAQLQVA